MSDNILGVCPTCYKVVTDKHQWSSIQDSSQKVFYHHECEPDRMKFIKENEITWKEKGLAYKEIREKNNCSVAELAELLGVSETKIRKFESGKPVTHAKLLGTAIYLFFRNIEIQIEHIKEA